MFDFKEFRDTFSGKTVLVTGHTGFKGSWLCFILKEFGCKIYGYSKDEPEDKRHSYYALNIAEIVQNKATMIGDVCDFQNFSSVFKDATPDFFFHLAAQPIVSISYHNPRLTFETNILGVMNALEILRGCGPNVTSLIITSDKCYKNIEQMRAYKETDEMGGDDPYSASKGAAELVFHSYLVSYPDLCREGGVASVRAGNVFGGGDWSKNRLIPDCARQLFSSGTIEVRMPEAIRPWTFVVDILNGYLNLAMAIRSDPKIRRGSWNFASGETRTVLDIAETFIRYNGQGKLLVNRAGTVGKESGLLLIDPSKAQKHLGWEPKLPLDRALQETVLWYRAQSEGQNMRDFSLHFINQYFEKDEAR